MQNKVWSAWTRHPVPRLTLLLFALLRFTLRLPLKAAPEAPFYLRF